MSACTGAALSAAYIIVYCVVAALSARVCCYGLMVMTPCETGPLYIYIYDVGVGLI